MKTFIHKNILIIKKENNYYLTGGICPENYNQNSLEELTPEDIEGISQFNSGYEEIEVEFTITPTGIKIKDFHDLYQFNCTSNNLVLIEAICKVYALETNTALFDIESLINNPEKYSAKNFTDIDIHYKVPMGIQDYTYDHTFNFKFKGVSISGTNQMIKYSFFNTVDKSKNIINLITSLEDLVDYYMTINKILAIACHASKDTMYLSCDEWAIKNVGKFLG